MTPRRVLVANRGEIAVRVMRTCRALAVETVAVHSEHDAAGLHVRYADRAVPIPDYLDAEALVDAAVDSGCDAIHPGYGFLSENPEFARLVRAAGLAFVGPSEQAIETMGSKTSARAAMEAAGVPVVPGTAAGTPESLAGPAAAMGFPVLVKAVAGGGGKGMSRVDAEADFVRVARHAASEARHAFGDDRLYVEKLLARPRHVEVQVFGDRAGTVVALGERECSVQRRHQKIVEESPSPGIDDALRGRLSAAAVSAATAVDYEGAGTVEFLVDEDGSFYFLEMNTRLQVEHPVTEWVTGLDLVELQLRVAAGEPLPPSVREAVPRGHAIECRIHAEDPAADHLPQAGRLLLVREPSGPGVRVDSALVTGGEVSVHYDPLLAKVSTWGVSRDQAIGRLREALSRCVVLGVRTNLDHLQDVIAHPAFVAGETTTAFLQEHMPGWSPPAGDGVVLAAAAACLPASTASGPSATAGSAFSDPWDDLAGLRLGSETDR